MKTTLGKLILLVTLVINIYASSVDISLSAPAVYKGENVSFTITAKGGDVNFPNIRDIEGFAILGVSSSSSTSIINGDISKSVSKTYTIRPTKSVTIPSLNVSIDGDNFKTKPKKIVVVKPTKSKNGDNFIVEIGVDKTNLKVGQSTKLIVKFKQRLNARADKLNLSEPKIENFWIKKIDDDKKYNEKDYIVQEFSYLITAQKAGKIHMNALEADIGKVYSSNRGGGFFNDPFFNSMNTQIRWAKIYSNELDIDVSALPNKLELYGDFNIKASVDKNEVVLNKPVNLTINIQGTGNLEDIKKFELEIPEAVVYSDEPKIKTTFNGTEAGGSFTQKIAIIASDDFTIEPIVLKYFDKKTNSVKTIKTNRIDIKVKGAKNITTQPKLEKQAINSANTNIVQPAKVENIIIKGDKTTLKYIFLIIGFILGGVTTYLILRKNNSKKQIENHIIKKIKNAKNDKELFEILLPYSNDDKIVANILALLEENIYGGKKNKIDKQKLYDLFL